jgi:hypothetical protein
MKEVFVFALASAQVALVFLLVGYLFNKVVLPLFKK